VLSQQRFQQLDHLLSRAGMYTNFLKEQMQVWCCSSTGWACGFAAWQSPCECLRSGQQQGLIL